MMLSLAPVSVTVCGVSQLPFVNVSVEGLTVASPVSAETTCRTTLLEGCASRTTVNVSAPPASVTVAVVLLSVIPSPTAAAGLAVAITGTTEASKAVAAKRARLRGRACGFLFRFFNDNFLSIL